MEAIPKELVFGIRQIKHQIRLQIWLYQKGIIINIWTIIPKQTHILEGTVAPNFGQPGGGYQYYVSDPSVVIGQ